jgi:hypothetical protein
MHILSGVQSSFYMGGTVTAPWHVVDNNVRRHALWFTRPVQVNGLQRLVDTSLCCLFSKWNASYPPGGMSWPNMPHWSLWCLDYLKSPPINHSETITVHSQAVIGPFGTITFTWWRHVCAPTPDYTLPQIYDVLSASTVSRSASCVGNRRGNQPTSSTHW